MIYPTVNGVPATPSDGRDAEPCRLATGGGKKCAEPGEKWVLDPHSDWRTST